MVSSSAYCRSFISIHIVLFIPSFIHSGSILGFLANLTRIHDAVDRTFTPIPRAITTKLPELEPRGLPEPDSVS